jgi:nucleotide-binding universal stress UspA family protein
MKLEGGDPGHTVVEKCEAIGANLLVVGCRGLGTIRRKILGSVSEYIVHHSNVPVFICRH